MPLILDNYPEVLEDLLNDPDDNTIVNSLVNSFITELSNKGIRASAPEFKIIPGLDWSVEMSKVYSDFLFGNMAKAMKLSPGQQKDRVVLTKKQYRKLLGQGKVKI